MSKAHYLPVLLIFGIGSCLCSGPPVRWGFNIVSMADDRVMMSVECEPISAARYEELKESSTFIESPDRLELYSGEVHGLPSFKTAFLDKADCQRWYERVAEYHRPFIELADYSTIFSMTVEPEQDTLAGFSIGGPLPTAGVNKDPSGDYWLEHTVAGEAGVLILKPCGAVIYQIGFTIGFSSIEMPPHMRRSSDAEIDAKLAFRQLMVAMEADEWVFTDPAEMPPDPLLGDLHAIEAYATKGPHRRLLAMMCPEPGTCLVNLKASYPTACVVGL